MGKVMIVKGADFSDNAVGKLPVSVGVFEATDENVASSEYLSQTLGYTEGFAGSDNKGRGISYLGVPIPVGKRLYFKDQSLWTKYKMALAKETSARGIQSSTWDTAYTGTSYIQSDVVIVNEVKVIMVLHMDGSNVDYWTEDETEEVTANLRWE
jgi:hypothetical protein